MRIIKREQPAPLLIVLVSFDPSREGIDHYDPEHPELLTDINSPYYGEQWISSTPKDYYDAFFKEGANSLVDYYKEMTGGKFWFYPAKIDHPANSDQQDGIITLVAPFPHPAALRNFRGYDNKTAAHQAIHDIVKMCDQYIDFSKYDLNGDGRVTPDEFGIIILNAGYDHSTQRGDKNYPAPDYENAPDPRARFMVHGTSQRITVETRDGIHLTCFSNVGEHRRIDMKGMTIGTPAHELAHNLGAEDLYDTNRNGHGGSTVTGWPRAYDFSLESNGNHRGGGAYPTYLDPYHRVYLGWAEEIVVEDGIYTISSTLTDKYVVLRVNTPDPGE